MPPYCNIHRQHHAQLPNSNSWDCYACRGIQSVAEPIPNPTPDSALAKKIAEKLWINFHSAGGQFRSEATPIIQQELSPLLSRLAIAEKALETYEPIINGLTTCIGICSRERPIMDLFNCMQDDGTAVLERSWNWEDDNLDWVVPKDQIDIENPCLWFQDGRALARIFPLILDLPQSKEFLKSIRAKKEAEK